MGINSPVSEAWEMVKEDEVSAVPREYVPAYSDRGKNGLVRGEGPKRGKHILEPVHHPVRSMIDRPLLPQR